uniref:Uncharacterized protein n=1 Tax=Timspurckia oligopyrenoides TaxID=708627 RepID=A0A7S1EPV4_9RHOD|mmetsp:Transcript_11480/g.20762  ORF Transcript_11480/g.20762 Transcript_11480/m.20762 type:complete len:316 (+) Transcript_11480:27-974(+)
MMFDVNEEEITLRLVSTFPSALILSTFGGIWTTIGGILAVLFALFKTQSNFQSSLSLVVQLQSGLCALLLCWSIYDVLPSAITGLSLSSTLLYFISGALTTLSLSACFSRTSIVYSRFHMTTNTIRSELRRSGHVACIVVALHNFLEGGALCLASYKGLGANRNVEMPSFLLITSLAIENIPEGLLIALPLCAMHSIVESSDGSVRESQAKVAFRAVLFAGMAGFMEPFGVCVGAVLLRVLAGNVELWWGLLSAALALIAGMFCALLLCEMLPVAFKNTQLRAFPVLSIALGIGCLCGCTLQPLLIHYGHIPVII